MHEKTSFSWKVIDFIHNRKNIWMKHENKTIKLLLSKEQDLEMSWVFASLQVRDWWWMGSLWVYDSSFRSRKKWMMRGKRKFWRLLGSTGFFQVASSGSSSLCGYLDVLLDDIDRQPVHHYLVVPGRPSPHSHVLLPLKPLFSGSLLHHQLHPSDAGQPLGPRKDHLLHRLHDSTLLCPCTGNHRVCPPGGDVLWPLCSCL